MPINAFIDNRNDAPIIYLVEPEDASVNVADAWLGYLNPRMPALPSLTLTRPVVPQPYHLELWAEKTTMNEILVPLARRFRLNVVTGAGELSATACRDFVNRVKQCGRPARILYVSDFDPAGQSIPLAVARKVEFELYTRGVELDIQLPPVVLTHDQCVKYRLPRTPIKETERRAAAFEQRFGAGATELDALEALHSGTLRQILEKEILRYWNEDHDDSIDETCRDIEANLDRITKDTHADYQDELEALRAEWAKITRTYRAWVDLAKPVWQAIGDSLDEQRPDLDDVDWAEPVNADEDPDPLFDSARDYIEQIDRYKKHQDKPTERRRRNASAAPLAIEEGEP